MSKTKNTIIFTGGIMLAAAIALPLTVYLAPAALTFLVASPVLLSCTFLFTGILAGIGLAFLMHAMTLHPGFSAGGWTKTDVQLRQDIDAWKNNGSVAKWLKEKYFQLNTSRTWRKTAITVFIAALIGFVADVVVAMHQGVTTSAEYFAQWLVNAYQYSGSRKLDHWVP